MKVMALIWVAITDRPTAHQLMERPARKKSSMRRLPRPAQRPKADDADQVDDQDRPVERGQNGQKLEEEKRASRAIDSRAQITTPRSRGQVPKRGTGPRPVVLEGPGTPCAGSCHGALPALTPEGPATGQSRSVITGFNTDVKYRGVVYHVQTEDKGPQNPLIETLVYKGGEILASRRLPYGDLIKAPRRARHHQAHGGPAQGHDDGGQEGQVRPDADKTMVEDLSLDEIVLAYPRGRGRLAK